MTAIVFDLDGTLIDSAPDIRAIANKVLADEGAGSITLEETRDFIGNGAATFVARMMAARGVDTAPDIQERMLTEFKRLYNTAVENSVLYPGVADLLEQLKSDGHVLGLCTNKPLKPAHYVLEHFGLLKQFDAVLGGDSLPETKPHPAPLLKTFEMLSADSENSLYVGDSEVDAETAERADVPFALFLGGYRKTPAEDLPHEMAFEHFNAIPVFVDNRFP